MSSIYEIYRKSTLGVCLEDTLDELVVNGIIDPHTAIFLFKQFDSAMADALTKSVKSKAHVKGDVHTYRFCDEVWTFVLKNLTIKMEAGETVKADGMKLVALTAAKQPAREVEDE